MGVKPKFWSSKGSGELTDKGAEEVRIGFVAFNSILLTLCDEYLSFRFRTLSLRADTLEAKPTAAKRGKRDPNHLISQIDVHLADTNEVFTRFGTSPTLGLEHAAVERRSKDGKNVISKPPTKYWQKVLNYIFGGFNFLMWIAFIVTIVGLPSLMLYITSHRSAI